MARTAKATTKAKPVAKKGEPGSRGTASTKTPAKGSKGAAAFKRAPAPAVAAPKVSKDELRAQVEKLEQANATLRTKSREANRVAKTANARIAELEDQVAQLEKKLSSQAPSAKRGLKAATPVRGRRKSRDIDPGDGVPPGVAVEEPAPLDDEAHAARESLEEHLGGE